MPKEWVIDEYAGYGGLRLQDCEAVPPQPGQVQLRIEAFALNWGDMNLMMDQYSFSFESFPARIGFEAAGTVEAVGEGVTDIEIGGRYCTLPYFYINNGASADTLTTGAKYLTPAPDGMTAVEASSDGRMTYRRRASPTWLRRSAPWESVTGCLRGYGSVGRERPLVARLGRCARRGLSVTRPDRSGGR